MSLTAGDSDGEPERSDSTTEAAGYGIRSQPLDISPKLLLPLLQVKIDRLTEEVVTVAYPEKAPTRSMRAKLHGAVAAIAIGLSEAYKTDSKRVVGINLKKSWYHGKPVSYAAYKTAYDALCGLDYIDVALKGVQSIRKNTKIFALPKLIDYMEGVQPYHSLHGTGLGTLELRDEKPANGKRGPLMEFEETAETKRMRKNLRVVNRALLSHWVDMDLTSAQWKALHERAQSKQRNGKFREPVNLSKRTVKRVFNNRSFEQGGRFYGCWWQSVPSEYRTFITIDGKRTCEVDFSEMVPRLAYAEADTEPPKGIYDVGLPAVPRGVIKTVLNSLLNAPGKIPVPDEFSKEAAGVSFGELQRRIKDKHHAIAYLFHTGAGLKLMRTESDIAEQVMLTFTERNIPVLPVHDSFLMHHGHEDELHAVMQSVSEKRTGRMIDVKSDEAHVSAFAATEVDAEPVSMGVDEVLKSLTATDQDGGYYVRVQGWFNQQLEYREMVKDLFSLT